MLRSKLRGIIHHNYELVMNYRKLAIRAKGLVVQKKWSSMVPSTASWGTVSYTHLTLPTNSLV